MTTLKKKDAHLFSDLVEMEDFSQNNLVNKNSSKMERKRPSIGYRRRNSEKIVHSQKNQMTIRRKSIKTKLGSKDFGNSRQNGHIFHKSKSCSNVLNRLGGGYRGPDFILRKPKYHEKYDGSEG